MARQIVINKIGEDLNWAIVEVFGDYTKNDDEIKEYISKYLEGCKAIDIKYVEYDESEAIFYNWDYMKNYDFIFIRELGTIFNYKNKFHMILPEDRVFDNDECILFLLRYAEDTCGRDGVTTGDILEL